MLSLRLKTVSDYINENDYIVDIGCDHALLPIYLTKKKLVKGAIASDINRNALNNAIKNISEHKLEDKIKIVLSDGLENIDMSLVDTIVISGMGTSTVIKILESSSKLNNIKKIIVQSNNNYYSLRKKIIKLGYYIADENITLDNKKYYLTICFEKGLKNYKEKNYYWGIIKPENINYYEYMKRNYEKIFKEIPYKRIVQKMKMHNLLKQLNKIIKYCQSFL